MKPRITMSMTADGELEIWINEAGRDLLVRELQALNERSWHFHLGAFEGAEVEMQDRLYRDTDILVAAAKVIFRTDEQDESHFDTNPGDPS